jgi:hypothetical protein
MHNIIESYSCSGRMVKTGDWTVSDLITHLVTIQSTLTPDEITKLQMTSAFSKEGEKALPGKKSRYRAGDLYEPSVTNRQLGLPIIDWGEKTKWRSSSEEGLFLLSHIAPSSETIFPTSKASPSTWPAKESPFRLDCQALHFIGARHSFCSI